MTVFVGRTNGQSNEDFLIELLCLLPLIVAKLCLQIINLWDQSISHSFLACYPSSPIFLSFKDPCYFQKKNLLSKDASGSDTPINCIAE